MMPATIPKEAQIEAILRAREWRLAKEYGLDDPNKIKWTVTSDDIKAYIAHHGFPSGWVHFSEETYDGVYVLEEDANWTVSYKERGVIYSEEHFDSSEAALHFLLKTYFLKRHGID